ncbi:MAG TPA: SRPBCC family protein [Thermoleophilaceae bacterium]
MTVEQRLITTYAAFNTRDIDRVLELMTEDVDWPNAWEGGRVIGHDAVREYWTRQWAELDPEVRPTAFKRLPDGRVEVTVHQIARALDGSVLSDGTVLHTYAFRGDRVARMDVSEPAIELTCESVIHCSAEKIFDVIVDLRGQHRWLERSRSFRGTHEISSDPVTLGTTYREPGPLGVRNGTVTELDRPTTITFHQPMTLRPPIGTIDIVMRYSLEPQAGSTRVRRVVTLQVPRLLKFAMPLLRYEVLRENERTLRALKAYCDSL